MSEAVRDEKTLEEQLLQEGLDPEDYFEVRGRLWNPEEEHYTIEEKGTRRLDGVADALVLYFDSKHGDFTDSSTTDVRIELIHFRFGEEHIVRSRIVFPAK